MAKVKLDLKTADGKHLKDLEFSTPLYEVLKSPNGKYYIGEVIVLNLEYHKKPKKDIQKIYFDKDKAEQEVFKNNKLEYYPRFEDYKTNFKNCLKIIEKFSDQELHDFVQQHKSKLS